MYVYEVASPRRKRGGDMYIVGNDAEREGYNRFIGSCLVFAVRHAEVSLEAAGSLQHCLREGGVVKGRDKAAMMRVLDMAKHYGLAEAYGMYAAAVDESADINILLDKTHMRSPWMEFVLAGGVLATDSDGRLEVDVSPIEKLVDYYDESSQEMRIALQEGYDSFGWQTEIVHKPDASQPYQKVSDRQHISLGYTRPDGLFEPMLTILSEDHPVRQTVSP